MAGPTLSRFLGLFRLRDASNAARMAAVSAAGEVSVAAAQLGEVQASPTANTVLDRLKAIATALAATLTVRSAGRTTATATIASAASLSGAVDLAASALAGLQMPAAWTAANLTFQVSFDGTTYADLYDSLGTEYTVTASTSRFIALPASDFLGARYLKIRSGTAAVPVAQGASRDIQLVASA